MANIYTEHNTAVVEALMENPDLIKILISWRI